MSLPVEAPLTSWKKGSRAQATADQVEKGIAGSDKSRDFGKPLASVKKGIVGSRGRKTAEKTRAQSPKSKWGNGGDPWSENTEKK